MPWMRILILLVAALSLTACASSRNFNTYTVNTKGAYLLDTGDVLRVTVYGDTNLSNSYTVGDNGSIAFPLVGDVDVRGATTQMAAGRIAAALTAGYMRRPDVAVEVSQYRPFYIQGEVANSGQFAYVYGMTVRAAISTAGGFTDTADRNRAIIYRPEGGKMAKGVVDLDFPIFPGDTVVVQDRWL